MKNYSYTTYDSDYSVNLKNVTSLREAYFETKKMFDEDISKLSEIYHDEESILDFQDFDNDANKIERYLDMLNSNDEIKDIYKKALQYIDENLRITATCELSAKSEFDKIDKDISLHDFEFEDFHLNDKQYFFGFDEVNRHEILSYALKKVGLDLTYEECDEMDELESTDYIITIMEFEKITLHEHECRYLGEFTDLNSCIEFIIKRIIKEGYYPNIFIQNDRGNMYQIVLNHKFESF